jgi:septal ring factor EnvC (AmiA/AmiB activator)
LLQCCCALLPQLRKLVATQEDLQEQLAAHLAACQAEADAAADAAVGQQEQLQQQLDEAQAAVAALADEVKVGSRGHSSLHA